MREEEAAQRDPAGANGESLRQPADQVFVEVHRAGETIVFNVLIDAVHALFKTSNQNNQSALPGRIHRETRDLVSVIIQHPPYDKYN